jgi:hypothetical protein
MKIKAYDRYHKEWIIISFPDDELFDWISSSPKGIQHKVMVNFEAIEGDRDSCDPKRWSDLEQFSII